MYCSLVSFIEGNCHLLVYAQNGGVGYMLYGAGVSIQRLIKYPLRNARNSMGFLCRIWRSFLIHNTPFKCKKRWFLYVCLPFLLPAVLLLVEAPNAYFFLNITAPSRALRANLQRSASAQEPAGKSKPDTSKQKGTRNRNDSDFH